MNEPLQPAAPEMAVFINMLLEPHAARLRQITEIIRSYYPDAIVSISSNSECFNIFVVGAFLVFWRRTGIIDVHGADPGTRAVFVRCVERLNPVPVRHMPPPDRR